MLVSCRLILGVPEVQPTLHYLGSKEKGPTLEEVKVIVDVSEHDDEESEDEQETPDAIDAVILTMDSMSLPDNNNCLVFVPFMNNIDEIVARCFKAYEGSLGARNTDYEDVLNLYHNDVVESLQDRFALQLHRSKDKTWHNGKFEAVKMGILRQKTHSMLISDSKLV
ncbi:hypothetical protein P692DRAFT_20818535 [Suillus brevipes Sb2]|nr:hypothetical protein P692DRAFT_20818535 [Suillus brevipes Sb2]